MSHLLRMLQCRERSRFVATDDWSAGRRRTGPHCPWPRCTWSGQRELWSRVCIQQASASHTFPNAMDLSHHCWQSQIHHNKLWHMKMPKTVTVITFHWGFSYMGAQKIWNQSPWSHLSRWFHAWEWVLKRVGGLICLCNFSFLPDTSDFNFHGSRDWASLGVSATRHIIGILTLSVITSWSKSFQKGLLKAQLQKLKHTHIRGVYIRGLRHRTKEEEGHHCMQ